MADMDLSSLAKRLRPFLVSITAEVLGTSEHGALLGLDDDDHTQYLNNARHDLAARHTLGTVVPFNRLDQLLNPSANKNFNMGGRSIAFSFLDPTDHPGYMGAFEIETSGTFSGALVHIHQHDGNPGATNLLHLQAEDVDVLPLRVEGADTILTIWESGGATKAQMGNDGTMTLDGDLLPFAPDGGSIGSGSYPWLNGHISQIYGQRYVEESIQVAGGHWYIPKSSATLAAAIAAGDTTITVTTNVGSDNADPLSGVSLAGWQIGDYLVLRDFNKVEYMRITGGSGVSWTVTRSLDPGSAQAWGVGQAIANLGKTDDGWLEFQGGNPAALSVWKRTGANYADVLEIVRLGNLKSWNGYPASDVYGIGIGEATKYLKYDPTNGLEVRGAIKADSGYLGALSVSGILSIASGGGLYAGTGSFSSPTTGVKYWHDGSVGRLAGYGSGALQWEAATDGTLKGAGENVRLAAAGLQFARGTANTNAINWYTDATFAALGSRIRSYNKSPGYNTLGFETDGTTYAEMNGEKIWFYNHVKVGLDGTGKNLEVSGTLRVDGLIYNTSPYGFSAYHNTTQGVDNGTWPRLAFTTEVYDTNATFDGYRFTAPVDGLYDIGSYIEFAVNANGNRALALCKNSGATYNAANVVVIETKPAMATGGWTTVLHVHRQIYLQASDYIEAFALQTAGTGTTINISGGVAGNGFWASRVA